ncbi:MAG: PLP-dependent aspartate aminotransferase family protein [Thermoanaerobaculales bacterium]
MKIATSCVHAGYQPEDRTGAVNVPIYATSTYAYRRFGEHRGWEYSRTGNPTRSALETAMAELEGGADGVAFASGLAAINAITDLFEPGDHLVAADNLYGGTFRLFKTITERHGIAVSFAAADRPEAFAEACTERTRMIFAETPTNPLMQLVDLEAVASIAQGRGALFVVDNTFLTPVLQRPIELGADLVVHSTTKYLNGHSDGIGGVVVAREAELGERLHTIQNNAGAILGPFDAYLVIRGLKTLAVRMAAHEANGRSLAALLAARDDIGTVHYPGLTDHPQHQLARTQQDGFGAMIAFDLGTIERARAFADAVELFILAESLGGVESLLCHPATMTHAAVPPDERERLGIGDGMLRLSVGIEDISDLEADIARGLDAAART